VLLPLTLSSADIFRPFSGFREVRLVNKESRHAGSCNLLCFVDFSSPPEARAALETLQGNYNIIFSASICIVLMLPISLDSACAQFHSFMFVCL
jgi:RNA recognition motif-containing protein